MINGDQGKCDFTQVFGQPPGAVALDLDNKVAGWKTGLASSIAIMPAECFELVDGLIVYYSSDKQISSPAIAWLSLSDS